jgi:hypothetical protein
MSEMFRSKVFVEVGLKKFTVCASDISGAMAL